MNRVGKPLRPCQKTKRRVVTFRDPVILTVIQLMRVQFGIRTLLLCMLLVGISFTVYHNSEYYKRWLKVEESIESIDLQVRSEELSERTPEIAT